MADEDDKPQPDADPEPDSAEQAQAPQDAKAVEGDFGPALSWENELDSYPLRKPSEDPRWAMWIFWIWAVFVVGALLFMIVLTVLGWFYD